MIVENLEFEVKKSGEQAASGIEKLTSSLSNLKRATGQTAIVSLTRNFTALNAALKVIDKDAVATIERLANALDKLSNVTNGNSGKINIDVRARETVPTQSTTSTKGTLPSPVSPDVSNIVSFGSEIDVLNQKLAILRDNMTTALAAGDLNGAVSARLGIISTQKAIDKLGESAEKSTSKVSVLLKSLGRIALYRVLRTIIKEISEEFKEGLENAYAYSSALNGGLAQSLDRIASASLKMKNQLGASFGELIQTLEPIITKIVQWLTWVADKMSQLFAVLGGRSTYLKAKDVTKKWAEDTEKGSKAAEEWKNQLLGFDEINKLTAPDDGSDSSKNKTPDYSEMFEEVPLDSFAEKVSETWGKITETIKENLAAIEMIAGASLLALGLILTLSGANIPLGLGLIVAGAIMLAKSITANWDSVSEPVKKALGIIMAVIGTSLLAVGAVLAFSGANIPLGIGLMLAGLATYSAIALNWNNLGESVQKVITTILAVLGGALLVIGAVLAFSGANIPLGIGLMVAGAVALGTAAVLNWDSLGNGVDGALRKILVILGGALLAVGAVLAFSGVSIPLGIALMATGAVALGAAAALNWNSLGSEVKGSLDKILAVVGTGLLAIGAVLAFSGVNIPLGIGLMAAGAVSLGAAAAMNWDSISKFVKESLDKILTVLGTALLAIGAVLAFSGVGIPLGIALMAAGALSLGTAAALNWDSLSGVLSKALQKIVEVVSAASIAIGAVLLFSGVGIPAGLALLAAGFVGMSVANPKWGEDVLNGIKGAGNKIRSWWDGTAVPWFKEVNNKFEEAKRNLVEKVSGIVEGIRTKAGELKGKISEVWNSIKSDASSKWDGIKSAIADKIDGVKNAAQTAGEGIKSAFGAAWDWVKSAGQSALNAVQSLVQSIATKVQSLLTSIRSVSSTVSSIGSTVGTALSNAYSSVTTWVSNTANTIKSGISSAVSSISSVRKYASGGYPEQGQLFIANEEKGNPELVGTINGRTAVANNDDILNGITNGVYSAVMSAMSNGNGGSQNINLFIDGRQVADVVTKYQRRDYRTSGV